MPSFRDFWLYVRDFWRYECAAHRQTMDSLASFLHASPTVLAYSFSSLILGSVGLFFFSGRQAVLDQIAYTVFGFTGTALLAYLFFRVIAPLQLINNLKEQKYALERENEALKDPKLQIEFELTQPSFYQNDTHVRGQEVIAYELYRVAVRNSNVRQELRVELTSITPCPQHLTGRLPLPLQFQHEPPTVRSVTLMPQDRRFVDVVMRSFSSESKEFSMSIQHSVNGVSGEIPDDRYRIEIKCIGESGPLSKWFIIDIHERKFRMYKDTPFERLAREF